MRKLKYKGYEKIKVTVSNEDKFWDWLFNKVLEKNKKIHLSKKDPRVFIDQTINV